MTKLKQLQEENERYLVEQNDLVTKGSRKDDSGKEIGWTSEEETRFNELQDKREALISLIETEKKKEQVRLQMAAQSSPTPEVFNIVEKEKPFSMARAVQAAISRDWGKAGKEREVMQTDPRWQENRVIIGMEKRADAVSVAGVTADGGALVGTEHRPQDFVDVIFNDSILGRLPVERVTGLRGNASVPVNTAKATATMVGEVAALPDKEKLAMSIKTASPKEMVTASAFSRMLALQSEPVIENILRTHVAGAIAEKLDDMFIGGTGVSPLLQGILNKTSGTGATALSGAADLTTTGANGGPLTFDLLAKLYSELGKKNIKGQFYWVTNNQVVYKLLTTLKDSANTNSGYIMMSLNDTPLGIPAIVSQSVPGTYAKGTSGNTLSPLILGKFDETQVYQWGDVAVEFDPYTKADNSQIVVRSYSFWDFLHKRHENYAVLQNIITT